MWLTGWLAGLVGEVFVTLLPEVGKGACEVCCCACVVGSDSVGGIVVVGTAAVVEGTVVAGGSAVVDGTTVGGDVVVIEGIVLVGGAVVVEGTVVEGGAVVVDCSH